MSSRSTQDLREPLLLESSYRVYLGLLQAVSEGLKFSTF